MAGGSRGWWRGLTLAVFVTAGARAGVQTPPVVTGTVSDQSAQRSIRIGF